MSVEERAERGSGKRLLDALPADEHRRILDDTTTATFGLKQVLLTPGNMSLESVHQAGHPAWRQAGCAGQGGHPQLPIRGFGKLHDRGALARGQASASDQVAVQVSREDFDNSHHCAPDRFLAGKAALERLRPGG
jgi:hypothetical protein